MPSDSILKSKKHTHIKSQVNSHSRLGNIKTDYAKLYNQLHSLRDSARYLNKPFNVSIKSCKIYLKTSIEMYEWVDEYCQ